MKHGSLVGSRRLTRQQRRRAACAAIVVVLALGVALAGWIGVLRADRGVSDTERANVLRSTESAVTALLNFGPGTTADQTRHTASLLTDPIALDFRARGYGVIAAGAIEAGVAVSARVVGVGLHGSPGDTARVLVFVDQQLHRADAPAQGADQRSGTTPSARWATMRRVDGNWLLADLQPVGDITM